MQDNNSNNPADDSVDKSTKSASLSPQRPSASLEESANGGPAYTVHPNSTHDSAAGGSTPVRTAGRGRAETYRIPWQMKLSGGGAPTPALAMGISAKKVPVPAIIGGLRGNRHRRKLSQQARGEGGDSAEKGGAKRRSLGLGLGEVHIKNPEETKEMETEHDSDVAGKEKEEAEPSAEDKKHDDGKKKIVMFDLNEPPPSDDDEEESV